MFKLPHNCTRLQQYVYCELPDVQAGFRKGRGTKGQIANICWIMEKAREFQKNIYFCFIDYAKAFDCVDHNKLWKILTNLDIILKSRDVTLLTKVHNRQSYGFSGSHVQLWESEHKEGWALKNWCFWIVVLEKTHESLLDSMEIKPVNPKGNQPWIFTGRADAETEAPVLWPRDVKSRLVG